MADFPIDVGTGSVSVTRYAPDPYKGVRVSPGNGALSVTGVAGPTHENIQPISFDLVLPALEFSPALTVLSEQFYEGDLSLPALEISMSAVAGSLYTGSITLPMFGFAASIDDSVITLPMLQANGELLSGGILSANITLPNFTIVAEVEGEQLYSGELVLPRLAAEGEILPGSTMEMAITIPQFAVESSIMSGVTGVFLISLPMFEVDGEVYGDYLGEFDLHLPALQMDGVLSFAYQNSVAYNLNVMNAAVTEYVNYGFNSFAKFHGASLAANEDGIYLLSGANDAGVAIDAVVEFGDLDFGTSLYKRVISAYVGYQNDGDMVLTVNTDIAQFKYRLPHIGKTTFHTNKMNLAKGIRSRYWRFGMYNVDGADFKLDTLEAVPVILTRRIG